MRRSAAFLAMMGGITAAPLHAENLYINAGRLVDVQAGTVLYGQCINVEGERIVAVAPCADTPTDSRRVDWSAFTVLPGLIDLHTHLADTGQSADVAAPLKTSPAATAQRS